MKRLFIHSMLFFLIVPFAASQTLMENMWSSPIGSGARAMGMGGAFIAIADDATAAGWNPGGLGQIEYTELSMVGSYYHYHRADAAIPFGPVRYGASIENGYSYNFDFIGISVPLRPIKESDFKLVLQYSYQNLLNLNLDYELAPFYMEADAMFNQAPHIRQQEVTQTRDYTGGIYVHSFGLGLKLTKWLNLGMTANIWSGSFEVNSVLIWSEDMVNAEGEVVRHRDSRAESKNAGDYDGTSFNFGMLAAVSENINIGMMFRSGFDLDSFYKYYDLTGYIEYPISYGFGIALRPIDNLTFAVDYTASLWSECKEVKGGEESYFPLQFLEYNPEAEDEQLKQYNTNQVRVGVEYILLLEDYTLAFRGGVYFDTQYFADASKKTPVYNGYTLGAGFIWKSLVIDLAYVYDNGKYQYDIYSAGLRTFSKNKFIMSVIYRI